MTLARPPRRALLVGALLLTACSQAGIVHAATASTREAGAARTAPAATGTPTSTAARIPTKVLVIVEENHTAGSAMRGMPYLASLAHTYGYTTAYHAISHPSLPNYLAMAGGSTYGVRDDAGPSSHRIPGQSMFDQAIADHGTAKLYAESMPTPCGQASTSSYAVKHNPWAYFSDGIARANCRRFDVASGTPSSGALRRDVNAGTLPTVGMLVPNICDDGHDCSLSTADGWLKKWLPVLMNGPDYRAGRLAIVVTFDEDDSSGPNTVLTTVVAPGTHHVVSGGAYTHYSLTRYAAELLHARALHNGVNAVSLRPSFHI